MQVLRSEQDESVNFVVPAADGGFYESRFVRRCKEYFICYLSSHSGCNRGCRMCHLTATDQTMMGSASFGQYIAQAKQILSYYSDKCRGADYIHFNWMARGEALENGTVLNNWIGLSSTLASMSIHEHGLIPKFNISTIMPMTYKGKLDETFISINPTIYYSLYSMEDGFRKKWLPGAMPVIEALDKLKEYQDSTKKIVKLHWAFIENENDDVRELSRMVSYITHDLKLRAEYNIVRYNPFNAEFGKEPEEDKIAVLADVIRFHSGSPVQVVPRVGFDVKASCGMFVEGNK